RAGTNNSCRQSATVVGRGGSGTRPAAAPPRRRGRHRISPHDAAIPFTIAPSPLWELRERYRGCLVRPDRDPNVPLPVGRRLPPHQMSVEPTELLEVDVLLLRDLLQRLARLDADLLESHRRLVANVLEEIRLRILGDVPHRQHDRHVVPRLAGEVLADLPIERLVPAPAAGTLVQDPLHTILPGVVRGRGQVPAPEAVVELLKVVERGVRGLDRVVPLIHVLRDLEPVPPPGLRD